MLNTILDFVTRLQADGILPAGSFSHNYWEQPASYICNIKLGQGYYIKKIKQRDGLSSNGNANIKEQFQRECEALKKIFPIFAGSANLMVPELIFADSDQMILVTRALNGDSFEGLCNQFARRIGQKDNNAVSSCYRIGQFLKTLHSSQQEPFTEEDVDKLIAYIKKRISEPFFSDEEIRKINKSILVLREKVVAETSSYYKTPVHHDLNPTNILIDGDSVNVLDFADSQLDSPYQDIVYFPLMLDGQLGSRIKYQKAKKNDLLNAFFSGYDGDDTIVEKWNRDGLYTLYLLKNYSIFAKTYMEMSKIKMNVLSPGSVKNKLVLSLDSRRVKKAVLAIATQWQ